MAQVSEIPPREGESQRLSNPSTPHSDEAPGRGERPSGQRTLTSPRARCWLKRVAVALAIFTLASGVALALTWHQMKLADARHAGFRDSGTRIKAFLNQYSSALGKAARQQDVSPLREFYSSQYQSPSRGHWQFQAPELLGGAELVRYQPQPGGDGDREQVLTNWADYLAGIAHIEHVKCKLNLLEAVEPDVKMTLTVKYVLDGVDQADRVFQDRFFFRWQVVKNPDPQAAYPWLIVDDELIDGVRVAGHADTFARLDPTAAGIDYIHRRDPKLNKNDPQVHLKFAVIEHAFGGVSAVDYDQDGRADLFFTDGVHSRLYRNQTPDGAATVSFVDVTDESGLGVIDQAHTGLFADLDNDGDKDLFVTRYLANCLVLRNDGQGHFTECSAELGLNIVRPCVSACLLDYNQDGYLDVYIGVNGNAFDDAPDIPFYAVNGQPNILLQNVAGRGFVDVTASSGVGSAGWSLAVTAGDYNNDGLPDLAVANDFGRKVLYRNEGNGTFTDRTKEAGVLDFSGGMGVAFADLNGDEFPDLLTSNIESGQRWFGAEITLWQYMRNIIRTRWIMEDLPEYRELYGLMGDDWRELGLKIGRGNSVFTNRQDGTFDEWEASDARRAGWAWSVNAFDFDNDADLDLYVSNGWVSGPNPKAPDL